MEEGAESTSSDLRQELARLQDREALLTHLLLLEREKRVRAEQLVEVEHLACLELGHRLERERKLVAAARKRAARLQKSNQRGSGAAVVVVAHGASEDDGVSLSQEHGEDVTSADLNTKTSKLPGVEDGVTCSPPVSSAGSDSGIAMMSPLEADFSTAVFGQLTSDLQQMLGIGSSNDASLNPQTDRLTLARDAVETNNAGLLQSCILSLDRDTLTNNVGTSLLELASECGHSSCVKVLLDFGCDPNGRGSMTTRATPTTSMTTPPTNNGVHGDGLSPLHLAAKNGHQNTLSLLLKSGADLHLQDSNGCTALFLAARGHHLNCVQTLMESGAKVETATKLKETALHAAVLANSPTILRNMIVQMRIAMETVDMTSVLNHCDNDGRTTLHLAASLGYKECAEVLCARVDVDTVKRDRWNRTPLDVATPNCKEILLNKESREVVIYVESCGSSPVHSSSNLTMSDSDYRTAIGRISILHHHKLPDLELLVQETFRQYWNALKLFGNSRSVEDGTGVKLSAYGTKAGRLDGFNFWDGCQSLQERILHAFSLSKSFVHSEDDVYSSYANSHQDLKGVYMRWTKAFLRLCKSRVSTMDLCEESILSYQIGSLCWKPGEIPESTKLKSLFSLFGELERQQGQTTRGVPTKQARLMEVTLSLKGFREGCLDQLAFDSMIPLYKLKEYVNLIEEHKGLMIQGAQGSGKTYLSLALANYLKYKCGIGESQVIHISLHQAFQRDDLFRLLHINGLLLPAAEGKREELRGERKNSTVHSRTFILILDDLSNVVIPNVLAELMTTLTYHGAGHPMWISDVFGRDGSLLYPCGQYYLHPQCYFITTQTRASGTNEPTSISPFPHIFLDYHSEPVTGVLLRQLTAKLIHCSLGDLPYSASFLPRLLLWTVDVWLLYNHLVQSLDLPELTCGIKNFLQCPIESKDPEVIINWICSIWNLHLAPSIENTLQQSNSRLSTLVTSTSPGPHHVGQFDSASLSLVQSNQTIEQHRYKALMQLLLACTRLVFLPTCPLQLEMRLKVIDQLTSRLEGLVGVSAGASRHREKLPSDMHKNDVNVSRTPPLSTHVTNRGTPPTPGKSQERRGSLSKHSPSMSKAGNMVSYEDMIRNSPRNTPKMTRNKPSTPTTPRKSQAINAFEAVKPVKPGTPVISPKKPPTGEAASPKVTEEVKLRHKSETGRSNTLRKLRSKTVALFSKEGGYSTLPRLFRKGSRSSLMSVGDDESKKAHVNERHESTKSETQQLNDLFDLLSSATHSNRYEDQRSPPPSSSPPPDITTSPSEGKGEDPDGGDNDLDDIFDLMTTINSDRIDNQRTSAPTPSQQDGADSPDKSKKKSKRKVAKYFLPTGSPFLQRKPLVDRAGAASPTNFSMPDLTADDEELPSTNSHYYVTRSTSNTPIRARARLMSDAYVHCQTDNPGSRYANGLRGYNYHSAKKDSPTRESDHMRSGSFTSDSVPHTHKNGEREQTLTVFRKRAGTFHSGTNSSTEPIARRKLPVYGRPQDHTISSPYHAASNPSISQVALPPTSPLATTTYSHSHQEDAFCYTDSEGSPFISHQHTQSNSTANTASLNENAPSFSSHQHTQSSSTANTASQGDEVVDTPSSTLQYRQGGRDILPWPSGSSGHHETFHQTVGGAPTIPLGMVGSVMNKSKKFQAKSTSVEHINVNGDDSGALDLFRAASDGEINQSSSSPSPCFQEETAHFRFQQSGLKTAENPTTSTINNRGGMSVTMMHCNYHSIYPEEKSNVPHVKKEFSSSSITSRARSISTSAEPMMMFDDRYDVSRRRSATMTSSSSYDVIQTKKRNSSYSNTSASERCYSSTCGAAVEQKYRRNTSNSSEGSMISHTRSSSPTSKVPRLRKSSESTSLLFSATLGFSGLLQAGSRDRLPSQPHANEEIMAEM